MKTCAIIGERPTLFKFKYNEHHSGCKRLKKRLQEQFIILYEQGVRRFMVGGALGVDMWSGEILLRMKEQPEYSGVELIVVLPHPNHDAQWDKRSKERMSFLIRHCAEQITIGRDSSPESYYKRNRYLTNHSDCLIAVYDRSTSTHSGIDMTVNQAIKQSLPVICISPNEGIAPMM